jgi:hypothetical protein
MNDCPHCDKMLTKVAHYVVRMRRIIVSNHRCNHLASIPKGDDTRWNFCKRSPCIDFKELIDGIKESDSQLDGAMRDLRSSETGIGTRT